MEAIYQADPKAVVAFLEEVLKSRLETKAIDWLQKKKELLQQDPSERDFYLTFGAAPRFMGKSDLAFTKSELDQARTLRDGFDPSGWTCDQACRVLLVMTLPHDDPGVLGETLRKLFETAAVDEQVALYSSLPLLPHPLSHRTRAAEGIRTNIAKVFDAVALNNPYPKDYFEEGAWNQMVLKAIFMERPIYKFQGLEERANPGLARMLSDFAHERWAAHRPTSPELWRPVGKHISEQILADLKQLFRHQDLIQHQAAALTCYRCGQPEAEALLADHPELLKKIEDQTLNWDLLGSSYWAEKES